MSFKRIEVLGFKSFADKLAIEFGDGITAIVGPNGCGKSNFADAIRWVLGEQAPKNLRGSSMQDVIFKGAEGRKSLSYCEVSLVFSNENKQFNLDYDEVVISRKLYRSGTSEYSLNRAPCLLKDIKNLLHDSGIGRDGYSIIGQGKVEQIVASKPEDRRTIFEEAAGIAKFKERKTEAENKLARTRENLVLLETTVNEIERQLTPMKEQAEKAKKYLDLREKLKIQEVNNYIYHYENANQNKQKISDLIEGLKEESEDREQKVQEAINKQSQALDGIKAIDEQIQAMREEILRLTVSLEKFAGDKRVADAKIQFLREQEEKLTAEIEQDKIRFVKINDELLQCEEEKRKKQDEINQLRAECDELQVIYVEVLEEIKTNEMAVSGNSAQVQDAIDKLSQIKSNITKLETEITSIIERKQELQIRQNMLNSKKEGSEIMEHQAQAEFDDAKVDRKNAWDNLVALRDNLKSVENAKKEIEQSLNQTTVDLSNLQSKNKLLADMQADYEGYSNTVRRLLIDAGKNSELNCLIVGVVGELVSVPNDLSVAIEMALGYSVQNIVTRNEQDAKKLVSYLKSKNYGRATFLPISSVKPKYISDNLKHLLSSKGCYGVASDLIEYDDYLAPIVDSLLSNTVVVNNMETAVYLANQSKFGFRIVTLDGDIINTGGSIAGGSKKSEASNLLSREHEIELNGERIKVLSNKVTELQKAFNNYQSMYDKLMREVEVQTKVLHDCDVLMAQKEEVLRHAQEDNSNFAIEIEEISQDLSRIDARRDVLEKELQVSRRIDANNTQVKDNDTSVDMNSYDILREKRDNLAGRITDIKVKLATLESENASQVNELDRLLEEQEVLSQNIDENNALLTKNAKTIELTISMDNSSGNKEYLDTDERLSTVKAKVVEMEEVKEQLHSSLAQIEEDRTRVTNEYSKLQERIYQEEAKLAQIDTTIENMQERILEDYELTYLTSLDLKDPDYDPSNGMTRINELKREINKLGHVNVNAIEDSKELDARYSELTVQLEDLQKAESDVMAVIKDLSDQMTEKFDTQFQKINENFSRTFKELFGGGRAKLVLTDEDVLTAGVEIIAEPPGKALGGNLSLLSGGEKSLTAIAILFAILKLRPMPFCLLDEIDAALDDANVERFAKYLHRFSDETQFIVITHRKPTMELANNLYGVTMENKGVSKVVSVKLSEAMQTVQQN